MNTLAQIAFHGWSAALEFKAEDAWVGAFWRRSGVYAEQLEIWICLIPCLPIHLTIGKPAPVVCPGCYSVDDEPCASWCPVEEMRREDDERQSGRDNERGCMDDDNG